MIALPAPFDTVQASAGLQWSYRVVTLTVAGPGTVHRCRYQIAWIELREPVPWRGQPYVSASRRIDTSSPRQPFTAAATADIARLLLPALAGDGFDHWWDELHRARFSAAPCRASAQEACRVAAWWAERADLADRYAHGAITLRPVDGDRHLRTQRVVAADGRVVCEEVLTEAVAGDRCVGWLTRSGDLIPPDHLLEPPRPGTETASAALDVGDLVEPATHPPALRRHQLAAIDRPPATASRPATHRSENL